MQNPKCIQGVWSLLLIAWGLSPIMAATPPEKTPTPSKQEGGASVSSPPAMPAASSEEGSESSSLSSTKPLSDIKQGHPNADLVTLGQLDKVQQNTLLLQAELEQKKVAKQIQDLTRSNGRKAKDDNLILSAGSYGPASASQLQLIMIYGKAGDWRARLSYEKTGKLVDVKIGDLLPTGEKVVEVDEQFVVFDSGEFQWKVSL